MPSYQYLAIRKNSEWHYIRVVNWFSIETVNAKGRRTYYNSFVTDLAIAPATRMLNPLGHGGETAKNIPRNLNSELPA
jgi:hypothetical protein